jgi:cysteinyl-tRNA synthetase
MRKVVELIKSFDVLLLPGSLCAKEGFCMQATGMLLTSQRHLSTDEEVFHFALWKAAKRRELKAARQFALADRIREQLKELGVKLEDRADGTSWKFERPSDK